MVFLMTFESEKDKTKFEYIYKKYKKLLLYKSYGILKDYRLAEDASSEAFIRIYKNLHKIEDVDSNKTISFLTTIVKNTSLTMLAKEKRDQTDEYDENQQDSFNMEDFMISELSSEHIYIILNQLNEDLKSVFLLKFAHELSNREIGKILNMTENHVGVKLHRAKKKLSSLLIREGYTNETER